MPISGMAPMDRNMILRKLTPKKLRASLAVGCWPPKRDPMIIDITTTYGHTSIV